MIGTSCFTVDALAACGPCEFILLAMRAKPNRPAPDADEDRFGAVKGATLAVGVGLGIWLVIAWIWFG